MQTSLAMTCEEELRRLTNWERAAKNRRPGKRPRTPARQRGRPSGEMPRNRFGPAKKKSVARLGCVGKRQTSWLN